MSNSVKVFSKEKWLETATSQMKEGRLTQKEIDDACEFWVDELDGKTLDELTEAGNDIINRENWFITKKG